MSAHHKCLKHINEILELAGLDGGKACQLGDCALRGSAKGYAASEYSDFSGGGLRGFLNFRGFETVVIDIDGRRESLPFDLGLPIEDDSLIGAFDLIVGYALVEHIENQYELFRNIHNLCKVGGVVILNCPITGSYKGHGTWTYDFAFFEKLFWDCKYRIFDSRVMPLRYGRVTGNKVVIYVSYSKVEESRFVEEDEFILPSFDQAGYEKDRKLYDEHGCERKI